jgi:hypothetical protein
VPEKYSFLEAELPTTTQTYRTLSLVFDVGLYLSQVFIKNCKGISWQQVRRGKTYHDYGQPVLVGLGSVRCSPLLLVMVLAYGIADGKKSGTGLRRLYDIWSSKKLACFRVSGSAVRTVESPGGQRRLRPRRRPGGPARGRALR